MKRVATMVSVLFGLGLSAMPTAGQSIFSAAGLGLPVESQDGRTRALGGVGIGLMGPETSTTDPAALGLLIAPTAVITSQPSWVSFERAGASESGSFQNTRFPLVGVAYPAWKLGMMSVTFGSFLDQRFKASRDVTAELDDGTVGATDIFRSDGGASSINLTLGRRVGSNLAVGVSVGRYAGRVIRGILRQFDEADVDASVQPYQAGGRWTYSGTSVTGGASMQFADVGRLAASVTWAGTLNAEASPDTQGADRSYSLPMEIRLGGSALLAPGLMLAASYKNGDWADTGLDLEDGGDLGSTTSYGVGIELTRARLLGRSTPLRLGYRSTDLPFQLEGGGAASETAFTTGLGMILNEQAGLILASVDLGVERGERKDLNLVERFWRATLTLRVAGF